MHLLSTCARSLASWPDFGHIPRTLNPVHMPALQLDQYKWHLLPAHWQWYYVTGNVTVGLEVQVVPDNWQVATGSSCPSETISMIS